jgi:hypothetical protein
MADDLESLLRRQLRAEGSSWLPGSAVETTRRELAGRIRQRRRRQAVVVLAALGALGMGSVLAPTLRSAPPGHLEAGPVEASVTTVATAALGGTPLTVAVTPSGQLAGSSGGRSAGGSGADANSTEAPGGANVGTARSRPDPPGTPGNLGRPLSGSSGLVPTSPSPSSPPASAAPTTQATPSTTAIPVTTTQVTITTTVGAPTTTVAQPTTTVAQPTTTVAQPTTTVAPPTTSTQPPTYLFTDVDTGSTVTVPVGAIIDLQVTGCPGTTWRPVRSSAPTIVVPISTSARPTSGSAMATLTAEEAGSAVLHFPSASTCAAPIPPFRITVVVS